MLIDTVGQLDRRAASFSTRTVARATQVSSYFTRMGHSMKDSSSISLTGIDVSKDTLDVYFTKNGRQQKIDYRNESLKLLARQIIKLKATVVMEATGGYEMKLVRYLQDQGIACAVVNPKLVRDFARACGKLEKNDAIDARIIAAFGQPITGKKIRTIKHDVKCDERRDRIPDRNHRTEEPQVKDERRPQLGRPDGKSYSCHQAAGEVKRPVVSSEGNSAVKTHSGMRFCNYVSSLERTFNLAASYSAAPILLHCLQCTKYAKYFVLSNDSQVAFTVLSKYY